MAKEFKVTVEKMTYYSGIVKVTAQNPRKAQSKVDKLIYTGKLQTTMVEWGDPDYEDGSFKTTGDVD
jgi:hypothetical protein